jgi:hypothetical protein
MNTILGISIDFNFANTHPSQMNQDLNKPPRINTAETREPASNAIKATSRNDHRAGKRLNGRFGSRVTIEADTSLHSCARVIAVVG